MAEGVDAAMVQQSSGENAMTDEDYRRHMQAIRGAMSPCFVCGHQPCDGLNFKDAVVRVFRSVREYMEQRRLWSNYLGRAGL